MSALGGGYLPRGGGVCLRGVSAQGVSTWRVSAQGGIHLGCVCLVGGLSHYLAATLFAGGKYTFCGCKVQKTLSVPSELANVNRNRI